MNKRRSDFVDDDGKQVYEGDFLKTSFGIPPVPVLGEVYMNKGVFMVRDDSATSDCTLVKFKEYLGQFWIVEGVS